MLDFEMKVFNQLREKTEAHRSSLQIFWDRTIKVQLIPTGPPVCVAGYAGHSVLISGDALKPPRELAPGLA
jgi:hypothetical protein